MTFPPSRVIGLFPTPLLHAEGAVGTSLVTELVERFARIANSANARSESLSHTEILSSSGDPHLAELAAIAGPRLVEFGEMLFGERLPWRIKEIWCNVLEPGGHQVLHNHANSFVSGIVYLTPCHAESRTAFVRSLGSEPFVFRNTHRNSAIGPFNAQKWIMPAIAPGDLILFPSGLLHEVPKNRGAQRITMAFNAIPERLDSWGYQIGFTKT
jgi:uncharacterized protein (TIGR02466 family)